MLCFTLNCSVVCIVRNVLLCFTLNCCVVLYCRKLCCWCCSELCQWWMTVFYSVDLAEPLFTKLWFELFESIWGEKKETFADVPLSRNSFHKLGLLRRKQTRNINIHSLFPIVQPRNIKQSRNVKQDNRKQNSIINCTTIK